MREEVLGRRRGREECSKRVRRRGAWSVLWRMGGYVHGEEEEEIGGGGNGSIEMRGGGLCCG